MNREYTFRIQIFFSLVSCLLLFLFFSGCIQSSATQAPISDSPVSQSASPSLVVTSSPDPIQNSMNRDQDIQNSRPINVTIHSAFKTSEIHGSEPLPGNIFVVINMTIENLEQNEMYSFNETTVGITGGGPITQKLYTQVTNPIYWGLIPSKEKRSGEVVFGVKERTQIFTLHFINTSGRVILTQDLGSLEEKDYPTTQAPMTNSPVSQSITQSPTATSSPEMTQDAADTIPGSQNTPPINVTIHSAFKTTKIHGEVPRSGNIFVVMDMTIENPADSEAYSFDETTVSISGGNLLPQMVYTQLTNPIYYGPIPAKEKRSGEAVFGEWPENTQIFTLKFLNKRGEVIFTQELVNLALKDYASSLVPSALLDSKNFSYVVENLDTPLKIAQFADAKFSYEYHDGCISYPPEEFFFKTLGDCKDYSTFFSYILAQHGYDSKIVAYKGYIDGKRTAHVVVLFTDTDGRLKYATLPDMSVFRDVNSLDDLLAKECSRMGIPTISNYTIYPAGSLDPCIY